MITFTIPGHPVPKQRPRLGYKGRRAYIYTPEETRRYEEKVHLLAKAATDGPLKVPVVVRLKVYLGPRKRKGPDLDNIVKSILDGMNGAIFEDDRQVYQIYAELVQDGEERVQVEVEELI